jgi:two-component system cell cycle response regulator
MLKVANVQRTRTTDWQFFISNFVSLDQRDERFAGGFYRSAGRHTSPILSLSVPSESESGVATMGFIALSSLAGAAAGFGRKVNVVSSLKLLLIEDDVEQLDLLRQTLEDHFGVQTVVGATSLTEAMRHDCSQFDLIVADFNLPDGTGMELLEQVKARCTTPVILVTGENVGRTAAEAIRRGATDYVVKVGDYLFTIPLVIEKNLTVAKVKRENETLRAELETALQEVRSKNKQLEDSLRRVEEVAATDPLTKLYNRRHFGHVIEQLFAEGQRYESDLTCVMIDLDGYKQLNDSHGHQVGDQLLVSAARAISANLRRMDIAARYGGDEFVLLLPRSGATEAESVVTRIRDDFRFSSAALLHQTAGVTMSVGIASMRAERAVSTEHLIARADAALYRAKAEGRNRIVISRPLAA